MWSNVKTFYNQRVGFDDRLVLSLAIVVSLIGIACSIANAFGAAFPGYPYLPLFWILLAPFMIGMLIFAWYVRDMSPRLAYFTRFYTLYYFLIVATALIINGIQLTPFSTIDHTLARWDLALGINTTALLAWTHAHTTIRLWLEVGYSTIAIEYFFLPAVIAAFMWKKQLNEFLGIYGVSFVLVGLCYYFFPTSAPVSVFPSPYYLTVIHHTAIKFYQLHHYIQPSFGDGGLIAFPSCHILHGLLFIYISRRKWWLFVPVLLINLVGFFATILLGWHYLIDVMGGVIFFLASLLIYRWLCRLNPEGNSSHNNDTGPKVKCG